MPDLLIIGGIAAAVALVLGLAVRNLRTKESGSSCELIPEGREGQLAVRLAGMVGCVPRQALSAVQHELDIAPSQTDDVILKRAAYHYRNALPERPLGTYRDRAKG